MWNKQFKSNVEQFYWAVQTQVELIKAHCGAELNKVMKTAFWNSSFFWPLCLLLQINSTTKPFPLSWWETNRQVFKLLQVVSALLWCKGSSSKSCSCFLTTFYFAFVFSVVCFCFFFFIAAFFIYSFFSDIFVLLCVNRGLYHPCVHCSLGHLWWV